VSPRDAELDSYQWRARTDPQYDLHAKALGNSRTSAFAVSATRPEKVTVTGPDHFTGDEYTENYHTRGATAFVHPPIKGINRMGNGPWETVKDSEGKDNGHEQGTLFATQTPPRVNVLARTETESHLMPALMGLVAKESLKRFGELPTPPRGNMSTDSSRVANFAIASGLIHPHENADPDEPVKATNPYGGNWHWASTHVGVARDTTDTAEYTDTYLSDKSAEEGTVPPEPRVSKLDPMEGREYTRTAMAKARYRRKAGSK